jgi:hypothetical protein
MSRPRFTRKKPIGAIFTDSQKLLMMRLPVASPKISTELTKITKKMLTMESDPVR